MDFIGLNGEIVESWFVILTLTRLDCFSCGAGIMLVGAYLIFTCFGGMLLFLKVLLARVCLKLWSSSSTALLSMVSLGSVGALYYFTDVKLFLSSGLLAVWITVLGWYLWFSWSFKILAMLGSLVASFEFLNSSRWSWVLLL